MSATVEPIGGFYRRTLVQLDAARADLIAKRAEPHIIVALDVYRKALQDALHTPGVAP